MSKITEKQ